MYKHETKKKKRYKARIGHVIISMFIILFKKFNFSLAPHPNPLQLKREFPFSFWRNPKGSAKPTG
jgi:hypothetical protein